MKKSEAVKLLQEIILTHMNCPNDCCGDDTTMYETILSEIEDKIGMLPPETWRKHKDHPDLCYSEFIQLKSKVNMWEEE